MEKETEKDRERGRPGYKEAQDCVYSGGERGRHDRLTDIEEESDYFKRQCKAGATPEYRAIAETLTTRSRPRSIFASFLPILHQITLTLYNESFNSNRNG